MDGLRVTREFHAKQNKKDAYIYNQKAMVDCSPGNNEERQLVECNTYKMYLMQKENSD